MLQAIGLCFIERILPSVGNIIWHLGGWEEKWLDESLECCWVISAFFSTTRKERRMEDCGPS